MRRTFEIEVSRVELQARFDVLKHAFEEARKRLEQYRAEHGFTPPDRVRIRIDYVWPEETP